MSVRRLAADDLQPPAFAFSGDNQHWAEKKIAEYPPGRQQSAVIPLLWRAQEQEGWVTRPAIEAIARMLDMAYIRVLEVATFYTQFLLRPVGSRAHVLVCGTTPCMLRGAEDLREVCQHRINHEPFELSPDGTLSWEEVECLGACVNAPMVMIGNDTYEDLTVARFEEIVEAFARGEGASVAPGPQIARTHAAAEGGQTTLTEEPTATRTRIDLPPPPPPATPAAPAAPAAAQPAKPSAPQEPTMPGRKQEIGAEGAPAIKGPAGAPKVSQAEAEAARKSADTAAEADGEPNDAMREGAVGAEAPGASIDGGKAPGKPTRSAPGHGASAAGIAPLPADEPGGGGTRLFEEPAGAPDDLKLISGVGPVLEKRLNALGLTTYAQVAKLTPEQIAAVEGQLNFKGRVTRDRWLEQADALATGGIAEYTRRFGRSPR